MDGIYEAMAAAGFRQDDLCFNWTNDEGVRIISPVLGNFKTWQVKTNAVHIKGFRKWQTALTFAKHAPRYAHLKEEL